MLRAIITRTNAPAPSFLTPWTPFNLHNTPIELQICHVPDSAHPRQTIPPSWVSFPTMRLFAASTTTSFNTARPRRLLWTSWSYRGWVISPLLSIEHTMSQQNNQDYKYVYSRPGYILFPLLPSGLRVSQTVFSPRPLGFSTCKTNPGHHTVQLTTKK